MHELGICKSLVKQVDDIARSHHAAAVEKIVLQVGPLSGVVPELLRSSFPAVSARTIAEKAQLVIRDLPIRVHCKHCHADTGASLSRLRCGQCGDSHTELISGDELLLERVELRYQ